MLRPLTLRQDIAGACKTLAARLMQGADRIEDRLLIGFGQWEHPVYWRPAKHLWVKLEPQDDRFNTTFGTDDPRESRRLDIQAKIAVPIEGINRKLAGLFVRDATGEVWLAHTGRIGGSVTRDAFLRWYPGGTERIHWPDGQQDQVILIGKVEDLDLARQVGTFIQRRRQYST
jgi:hypothetical protein